jgi:hypothetical protein
MYFSIPRPIRDRAPVLLFIISPLSKSAVSSNSLSINLNLYPTQVHVFRRACFWHTRGQPRLRLLVVEWPLRYREEESQSSAAQANVESLVDVLGCEADEHGDDAACDEEEGGKGVGEGLAAEVLGEGSQSRDWVGEWRGGAYDLAFVDVAGLVKEGVHCGRCVFVFVFVRECT